MADVLDFRIPRDAELAEIAHALITWCRAYDEHRKAFEHKVEARLESQSMLLLSQQQALEAMAEWVKHIIPQTHS